MGIKFKLLNYNKKIFIKVQSQFSVKKTKMNFILNTFIVGFINNCSIINVEYIIEQSKRIFLFCFNLFKTKSFFIFINLNFLNKNFFKYIAYRSLEGIISVKWINGLLTNSLWIKPSVLILSQMQNNSLLKESFIKNLPFILLNDASVLFNKYFYFLISNDHSKKFMFLFYKNISNFFILMKLYNFLK